MKCNYCGQEIENAKFCTQCGAKIEKEELFNESPESEEKQVVITPVIEETPNTQPQAAATSNKFDTFAILGFIFSLVPFFTPILGFVFSIIGLRANKKGFAIAGIIISILKAIGIFLIVIFYVLFILLLYRTSV